MGKILADEVRQRRLGSRRRRVVGVFVAGLLCVSAGAFALTRPETFTEMPEFGVGSVACYEGDSTDDRVTIVDNSIGEDPVRLCGGSGSSVNMTACAAGTSFAPPVSVFRVADSELCDSLGLSPVPPDYEKWAGKFASLRSELFGAMGGARGTCVSEDEVRDLAQASLTEEGLGSWRLEVRKAAGTMEGPCGAVGFDLDNHTMVIQPGPRME